jgi:hypothetical protein
VEALLGRLLVKPKPAPDDLAGLICADVSVEQQLI